MRIAGMFIPYIIVEKEANMAATVNTPRTGATAEGCENDAPLVMTAL